MTVSTYLLCFLAGLLGMAFHVFAVKIPATKTAASVGNVKFTYGAFFQDELAAILANVIMLGIFIMLLPLIVKIKPEVGPYLIGLFAFVGYTGASFLIALMGKATAKINAIVNVKTDVADGVSKDVSPPASPTI